METYLAIATIYLFFLIVCIWKIRIKDQKDNFELCGREQTEPIKGIAILLIMFHHMAQSVSDIALLFPFRGSGYLAVAVFFFLSGWGLCSSYEHKKNYLKHFISNRIQKVFFPFVVLNGIYLAVVLCLFRSDISVGKAVSSIFTGTLDSSMWYIRSLLFFYAAFYVIFRLCHTKQSQTFMMLFISAAYFIFCYLTGMGKVYFDNSFSFALGVICCLYKEKVQQLCPKIPLWYNIIFVILFAACFVGNMQRTELPFLVLRILSTILFIICIIAMMKYLDFSHCIWAKKIGGISFGIYLIHFKVLEVLKHYGQFGIVQVILYIVLTFFLAYIFHLLQEKVFTLKKGNGID